MKKSIFLFFAFFFSPFFLLAQRFSDSPPERKEIIELHIIGVEICDALFYKKLCFLTKSKEGKLSFFDQIIQDFDPKDFQVGYEYKIQLQLASTPLEGLQDEAYSVYKIIKKEKIPQIHWIPVPSHWISFDSRWKNFLIYISKLGDIYAKSISAPEKIFFWHRKEKKWILK